MKLIEGIFNICMAVFILVFILLYLPRLWGFQIYAVICESENLPLAVGDAIFVKKQSFEETKPGDMITYSLNAGRTTSTRIVYGKDEQNHSFQIKEAGNGGNWISSENVLGVVWHKIHGLGYLASMASSFLGKLFLMAVFLWLLSAQIVVGSLNMG
ncbi:MAG: hypothetical protein ACI4EI_10515 [Muricoprocola sp.]